MRTPLEFESLEQATLAGHTDAHLPEAHVPEGYVRQMLTAEHAAAYLAAYNAVLAAWQPPPERAGQVRQILHDAGMTDEQIAAQSRRNRERLLGLQTYRALHRTDPE